MEKELNKIYLSREDKLSICKRAYNRIFNLNENDIKKRNFICTAIEAESPYDLTKKGLKAYHLIPELLRYKPSEMSQNGHWFNLDKSGMEKRRDILNSLIDEFS